MKNNVGLCIMLVIVLLVLGFIMFGSVGSSFNGQYRNNVNKEANVMISDNGDGTFAVVFVKCSELTNGTFMTYPVQIESIELDENVLRDTIFSGDLEIHLNKDSITIPKGKALGNEEFEGTYKKERHISKADPENFK